MKMLQKLMLTGLIALACNTTFTAMPEMAPYNLADVLTPQSELGTTYGSRDLPTYSSQDVIDTMKRFYPSFLNAEREADMIDLQANALKSLRQPEGGIIQRLKSSALNPTLQAARRFGSALKPYTLDLATSAGRGFRNIGSSIRSGLGDAYTTLGSQAGVRGLISNAISNNPGLANMWSNLNPDTKMAVITTVGALLASGLLYGGYKYLQSGSSLGEDGGAMYKGSINPILEDIDMYITSEPQSGEALAPVIGNVVNKLSEIKSMRSSDQTLVKRIDTIISKLQRIKTDNLGKKQLQNAIENMRNTGIKALLDDLRNQISQ